MSNPLNYEEKLEILNMFLHHRRRIAERIQELNGNEYVTDIVASDRKNLKRLEKMEKTIRAKWGDVARDIIPSYE